METFSTRILLIVVSLITSVFVARALGPEGRGLYAIALTVSMLGIQFSNLGLHSSNTPQLDFVGDEDAVARASPKGQVPGVRSRSTFTCGR